jgi:hypothetical protein
MSFVYFDAIDVVWNASKKEEFSSGRLIPLTRVVGLDSYEECGSTAKSALKVVNEDGRYYLPDSVHEIISHLEGTPWHHAFMLLTFSPLTDGENVEVLTVPSTQILLLKTLDLSNHREVMRSFSEQDIVEIKPYSGGDDDRIRTIVKTKNETHYATVSLQEIAKKMGRNLITLSSLDVSAVPDVRFTQAVMMMQ